MKKRPEKLQNVLVKVREHALSERIIDTRHAHQRRGQRQITFMEVMYVLAYTGRHEKAKDEWKDEYSTWNYAIRGKTLDGKEIRIPVFYIDADPEITFFGVATVIDLNQT